MPTNTRIQCLLLGLVGVLLALLPAMAQHLTGTPGLPEATTTMDDRDTLALPQSFGGTLGGGDFGVQAPT